MRFYSSINALRSSRSTLYVAANLIHQWVTPSGDRSLEAGILPMTGARSNVTHRGHDQVVQCWLTSGTGTAPPNESRPRGMLSVRGYKGKGNILGLQKTNFKSLNKSRLHPYDKGWDDRDEMLGMPTCAEIAWHSGAILVEIIVVYINVLGSSRSTCGGQFIHRRVITIEYDTAQQVEQELGPQAPRKQPHRQLEWVEVPWDGRDTRTVGPWSFQGAV
ncbi:uncharacterized protein EI90DRAFT_3036814 [Cantharellus anzutake]|uniref:uncharacterized protein n=1 Tax=Cantharellus anzutake TaxID=1750568 RepID=UPI001903C9B2|nr:uncharacterized protein EI90DRAFT_3036814 [Cantharellus anzutake]KAF8339503.1 hypothetical protein EI90DRAFT_3036814 [Cantharellus anzutake]